MKRTDRHRRRMAARKLIGFAELGDIAAARELLRRGIRPYPDAMAKEWLTERRRKRR